MNTYLWAGLKNNWLSLLDIILEDHPELTREEAQERLDEIILQNRRLNDRFGIMDAFQPETTSV